MCSSDLPGGTKVSWPEPCEAYAEANRKAEAEKKQSVRNSSVAEQVAKREAAAAEREKNRKELEGFSMVAALESATKSP